jgi:hypothetical protein
MRTSRSSPEQIIRALREAEAGRPGGGDLCPQLNVADEHHGASPRELGEKCIVLGPTEIVAVRVREQDSRVGQSSSGHLVGFPRHRPSWSICYPYAYVTTTRFCLANACGDPERTDDVGITGCSQECRRYAFELTHPVMPVPLIRKGNTEFLRNDRLPAELETMSIDRIVHEPEIPL